MPGFFKKLPSLDEGASYLLGFLSGYIATDGSVQKDGGTTISSSKEENILFAEAICQRFGIRNTGVKKAMRKGYGLVKTPLYSLRIETGALPPDFYQLKKQKCRAKGYVYRDEWKVVSIKKTKRRENVYCFSVPQTGNFVLEGNILTGNCAGGYSPDSTERLIYSYRDANNLPHATFEVQKNNNEIVQIKGKGNGPIHPRYIHPILEFLKVIGMEIRPNDMVNLGYHHIHKDHLNFLKKNKTAMKQVAIINNEVYAF